MLKKNNPPKTLKNKLIYIHNTGQEPARASVMYRRRWADREKC